MAIVPEEVTQRRKVILTERRNGHPKAVETHRRNLDDGLDAIIAVGDADKALDDAKLHDALHDAHLRRAFVLALEVTQGAHEPNRRRVREIAREILAAAEADKREDLLAYAETPAALERAKSPLRRINGRSDTGLRRAGA